MLFKVEKLKQGTVLPSAGNGIEDTTEQLVSTSVKLTDVLKMVGHGKTVHWLSEGDWSMHQLLQELLMTVTGPADVYISSYAFSELPARTIANLKATGDIKNLYCLIDSRVDVRSASALSMMKNTADSLKLCHTHAKVTIIKNDEWFLAVVGSANYTTNKRYEAGIISAAGNVASFHQKWVMNELNKAV